jgi:hypothetical protein
VNSPLAVDGWIIAAWRSRRQTGSSRSDQASDYFRISGLFKGLRGGKFPSPPLRVRIGREPTAIMAARPPGSPLKESPPPGRWNLSRIYIYRKKMSEFS